MFGNRYDWRVEHWLQPQSLLPEKSEACLGHSASEWQRQRFVEKVELSVPKHIPCLPVLYSACEHTYTSSHTYSARTHLNALFLFQTLSLISPFPSHPTPRNLPHALRIVCSDPKSPEKAPVRYCPSPIVCLTSQAFGPDPDVCLILRSSSLTAFHNGS